MKKSEKMLVGALAASVVMWIGWNVVKGKMLEPLEGMRKNLANAKTTLDLQFAQLQVDVNRDKELKAWRAISLPRNPNLAANAYQQWLITLAQNAGFEDISQPEEPRPGSNEKYATVSIKLVAHATLDELSLFLDRFESVNLMHRISQLKVDSPRTEGDPELLVTVVAEGLSLKTAEERSYLFPKTELFAAITKDSPQLIVTTHGNFPEQAPFMVRIGEEFLQVTDVQGDTWTVKRGMEPSFEESHDKLSEIELFPEKRLPDTFDTSVTDMRNFSLFTKPPPPFTERPHLESTVPPPAVRGRTWRWAPSVAGWNPVWGSRSYDLLIKPSGMIIDKKTGALTWAVGEQVQLGEFEVQMYIWGPNSSEAEAYYSPKFNVRVRDPNTPPVITSEGPLKFFIGRQSTVRIQAEDRGPNATRLRYSLGNNAPNGMEIDANTGVIRWRPTEEMAAGDMNVQITVTDTDELAATDSQTFQVSLAEDSAQYAYLTASLQEGDADRYSWSHDRATGQRIDLRVGEQVQIADFNMKVIELGPSYAIVERDGELYRWEMEQALVNMKKIPRPAPQNVPEVEPADADGVSGT